jgi:hypothetical protein
MARLHNGSDAARDVCLDTPAGLRGAWEANALREFEESRAAGNAYQGVEYAGIIATGGRREIRRMHTIAFRGIA